MITLQLLSAFTDLIKDYKVLPFVALILILLLVLKYGLNILKIIIETFKDNPMFIVFGLIIVGIIIWIITWFY